MISERLSFLAYRSKLPFEGQKKEVLHHKESTEHRAFPHKENPDRLDGAKNDFIDASKVREETNAKVALKQMEEEKKQLEKTIRHKDQVIEKKDEVIEKKDEMIREKDLQIKLLSSRKPLTDPDRFKRPVDSVSCVTAATGDASIDNSTLAPSVGTKAASIVTEKENKELRRAPEEGSGFQTAGPREQEKG